MVYSSDEWCLESDSDFVRRFLLGDIQAQPEAGSMRTSVVMGPHTEGWMGIPHGGISMAAVTELAFMLQESLEHPGGGYPFTAEFRLGGTSARIGDTVHLDVASAGSGFQGSIKVNHETVPYLKADLRTTVQVSQIDFSSLPFRSDPGTQALRLLPYYKNCFVCGSERSAPGLKRKFYLYEDKTVVARAGFDRDDFYSFYLFQNKGNIHFLPLMALLDETLGWAGFMMTSSGAVTVRISFAFHRPIPVGAKMFFYGRGERAKGRTGSRLLFWASGGIAVVGSNGELEPVATASGQWMAVQELTEQMKIQLMPREITREVFRIAGHVVS